MAAPANNQPQIMFREDPHVTTRQRFDTISSLTIRMIIGFGAALCSQLDQGIVEYLHDHPHLRHSVYAAVGVVHGVFLVYTIFASLERPENRVVIQTLFAIGLNSIISYFFVSVVNKTLATIAAGTWGFAFILVLLFKWTDLRVQVAFVWTRVCSKFCGGSNPTPPNTPHQESPVVISIAQPTGPFATNSSNT